jgi:uncharacterized protein YdaU (DUF1376 family)
VHYYKRNIGDYYKKAGRLTMLEHGAYTLLMDACYDREQFPTAEQAIDWCGARGQDEIDAVNSVLAKFFSLKPNKTYFQQHISEVLSAYKEIGKQNKRIALQRESTKRARTVDDTLTQRSRTDHALAPNHKPLTTNQEPLTNNQEPDKGSRFAPPSLDALIVEFTGKVLMPEIEAKKFLGYYGSNDWKVGKNKMKSWKHAVAGWAARMPPVEQVLGFEHKHMGTDWADDIINQQLEHKR